MNLTAGTLGDHFSAPQFYPLKKPKSKISQSGTFLSTLVNNKMS
jgi:hypothetical protein